LQKSSIDGKLPLEDIFNFSKICCVKVFIYKNKKEVSISTNLKIKSVPSRPIRIESKASGELFLSANQLLLSAGDT
jgi:hypothetical protein